MQFVPLWDSILDSPKLMKLRPDLFRAWALILLAAQRHDRIGGTLPDTERLAWWLSMDEEDVESHLQELCRLGLLESCEDVVRVHDWNDWRCIKDKTSRERVKRHREKRKSEEAGFPAKAACNGAVTDVKRAGNAHHKHLATSKSNEDPPTPPLGDVDDDVVNFGRISFGDRFDLEDLGPKLPGWRAAKYADGWIKDAMLCAGCNARAGGMAAYVNTCLRRWKAKGGPDPEEVREAKAKVKSGGTNMPGGPTPEEAARYEAEIEARGKMTREKWKELQDARRNV